jgi:hypothetical protein
MANDCSSVGNATKLRAPVMIIFSSQPLFDNDFIDKWQGDMAQKVVEYVCI